MYFSTALNRKEKSRNNYLQSFTFTVICLTLLAILSLGKSQKHEALQKSSSELLYTARLMKRNENCRLVHHARDKCAFIKANCQDEDAGLLSYLSLYYCYLVDFHMLAFGILSLWLALLFTTIGIAASDFFCINLNTVASILGLSESIVGTTFLAFGNGSPDFFSTFAAMNSNSGSLAVGELIGAAAFITTMVAGSMALVSEFRVGKKNLIRDLGFFIVAICLIIIFLADGLLHLWECLVMVGYYILYVVVVCIWHWYFEVRRKRRNRKLAANCQFLNRTNEDMISQQDNITDEESSVGQRPYSDFEDINISEQGPYSDLISCKNNEEFDDSDEETNQSIRLAAEMTSNMRVTRPTGSRRNTITPIRPSLVGALEFRSSFASFMEKSRQLNGPLIQYFDDLPFIDPYSYNNANLGSDVAPLRTRAASFNDATAAKTVESVNSRGRNHSNIDMPVSTTVSQKTLELSSTKQAGLLSAPAGFSSRRSVLKRSSLSHSGCLHKQLPSKTHCVHEDDIPAVKILLASPIKNPDELPDSSNDLSGMLHIDTQHLQVQSPVARAGSHSRQSSTSTFPTYFELQNNTSIRASIPSSPVLPYLNRVIGPSLNEHDQDFQQSSISWWPNEYFPNLNTICSTLFPTLCTWGQKSIWDKFVSVISAPSIFLLAITLPVVESESSEGSSSCQELNKVVHSNSSSRMPSRRGLSGNTPIEVRSEWLAYRRSLENQGNFPFLHQVHGPHSQHASSVGVSRSHSISSRVNEITLARNEFTQNTYGISLTEEWNRWLVSIQIFTSPLFLIIIFWTNSAKKDHHLLVKTIFYSLLGSLITFSILMVTTSATQIPRYRFILCFLGFIVSIAWIFTIAGEVVGVLKAIGIILDLSDAILGLTVFALGGSLGDLVADINLARLGFPVMALSACFGGPMFNILLGIGLSGVYVTVNEANKNQIKNPAHHILYRPYQIEVSSTLIISVMTLLTALVGILISVPLNKWVMGRRIGWSLILLWSISTVVNVGLEISGVLKESGKGINSSSRNLL
ncbi:putative cation exchanger [Erysiphe necator]|nr:putative cation exchanger [Erysiphe necator]